MARFVQRYYKDRTVALNDIGYVGFLTDAPILDLMGLASSDVAHAMLAGGRDARFVEDAARRRGAAIAVLHVETPVPPTWDCVAEWKLTGATVLIAPAVRFYAITPTERSALLANLRAYAPELPATVAVRYFGPRGSVASGSTDVP